MTVKIIRFFLWSCLIPLSFAFFSGCATSPNIPFAGRPCPATLEELDQRNPLLVKELGKLPEIQDGILESEKIALERISDLYDSNPKRFNQVFNEMYKIGIPEVRKYCSPLQALFWLAEDGVLESETDLINRYSLDILLIKAWDFSPAEIPDQQILEIINGIKDTDIKEQYIEDWKTLGSAKILKFLLIDIKRIKNVFSKDAIKKIKNLNTENPKWSDFETVKERLNAPELVDYYERKRFSYVYWWTIPGYNGKHSGDPYWVFKYNKGDCLYTTSFTVSCLKGGGYKAWEMRIRSYNPAFNYHAICVFYWDGKKYVMDNGKPLKAGIVSYEEYKKMHSTRF